MYAGQFNCAKFKSYKAETKPEVSMFAGIQATISSANYSAACMNRRESRTTTKLGNILIRAVLARNFFNVSVLVFVNGNFL